MTGKTHLLGGAAAAAALLAAVPMAPPLAVGIGAATLGASLLPDIDTRASKISNRVGLLGSLVRLFFSHRGLLHDSTLYLAMFGLLAAGGLRGPGLLLAVGLLLGILSHILLDALTPMGVPLLLLDVLRVPLDGGKLKRRKYRLLKLRAGGIGEWVVGVALVALTGLLVLF